MASLLETLKKGKDVTLDPDTVTDTEMMDTMTEFEKQKPMMSYKEREQVLEGIRAALAKARDQAIKAKFEALEKRVQLTAVEKTLHAGGQAATYTGEVATQFGKDRLSDVTTIGGQLNEKFGLPVTIAGGVLTAVGFVAVARWIIRKMQANPDSTTSSVLRWLGIGALAAGTLKLGTMYTGKAPDAPPASAPAQSPEEAKKAGESLAKYFRDLNGRDLMQLQAKLDVGKNVLQFTKDGFSINGKKATITAIPLPCEEHSFSKSPMLWTAAKAEKGAEVPLKAATITGNELSLTLQHPTETDPQTKQPKIVEKKLTMDQILSIIGDLGNNRPSEKKFRTDGNRAKEDRGEYTHLLRIAA